MRPTYSSTCSAPHHRNLRSHTDASRPACRRHRSKRSKRQSHPSGSRFRNCGCGCAFRNSRSTNPSLCPSRPLCTRRHRRRSTRRTRSMRPRSRSRRCGCALPFRRSCHTGGRLVRFHPRCIQAALRSLSTRPTCRWRRTFEPAGNRLRMRASRRNPSGTIPRRSTRRSFPSGPPCTPGFARRTRRTESSESRPPRSHTRQSTRSRGLRCRFRHRRRTRWSKCGFPYARPTGSNRRSRPRWEDHPHPRRGPRRCKRHPRSFHPHGKQGHRRSMCPAAGHPFRMGRCPFVPRDLCRRRHKPTRKRTPKEKNGTRY